MCCSREDLKGRQTERERGRERDVLVLCDSGLDDLSAATLQRVTILQTRQT